ncbi:MAG: hypothetical protein MUO58_15435 [Anaerolineales bacterium]|nr:hypothetical protein [Anaerolineales bacterium]
MFTARALMWGSSADGRIKRDISGLFFYGSCLDVSSAFVFGSSAGSAPALTTSQAIDVPIEFARYERMANLNFFPAFPPSSMNGFRRGLSNRLRRSLLF